MSAWLYALGVALMVALLVILVQTVTLGLDGRVIG